ncbi:BrnA antitoxin family protein [Rhizorhapis sp.]|uniref:BrnA antitoxin family protein n=1 Tax=Rhizorhapis sp. TaxID=1968842 RepID=UPI002B4A7552|nr:BrnA antitoxin family protein [Rhizorhapis sp.]HKR15949.1 BrnA antitoxin family protein [Rhizorhapis sp.]
MSDWVDPDDAPELTEEFFRHAEVRVGGKLIRPATGYLSKEGFKVGRPPKGAQAKRQVTLRLDPDVIARFKEGGPGWQSRMNEALRKAAGL